VRRGFLVLVLLGAAAAWGYTRYGIVAPRAAELLLTGFVEADERIIRSEVEGVLADVLVREGDPVTAGALLVRIDARDAQSRRRQQELAIAALKAQVGKAEATLALTRAQVPQAIEVARADLARARAAAGLAETDVGRERGLAQSQAHTRQALDDAETQAKLAAAEVARAESALELASARRGEITVAEATLHALEVEIPVEEEKLHEIDILLDKYEIHADAPGTVESKLVSKGELAQPGRPLVSLLDEDDKYVRVYVPVPDLAAVRVGTRMVVAPDYRPDEQVEGTVEWIEAQASFAPRNYVTRDDRAQQVYQARVRLPRGAAREIRAGVEVEVRLAR
jgi:HlyD family secretion protein